MKQRESLSTERNPKSTIGSSNSVSSYGTLGNKSNTTAKKSKKKDHEVYTITTKKTVRPHNVR